ncbi:MAG: nuclear transport factor 2 family protein [Betaproteobacteria bacterium]
MNKLAGTLSCIALFMALFPRIGGAATAEEDLNALEQIRYEALIGKDWQTLDTLLSDEFFYNTAGGASMTKSAFIDLMKSGAAVVNKAVRDESIVRDYGEIALVSGVAHIDVTVKGEDKTIHSRYLHVWIRKGMGWKLVARQATYLPEKK